MPRQSILVIQAVLSPCPLVVLAHPLAQPSAPNPTCPVLTINSTLAANQTAPLSISEKVAETSLAFAGLFIVAMTYIVLTNYAAYLVNTSKLPFVALATNISAILEATWPKSTSRPYKLPCEIKRGHFNAIRLLYLGRMISEPLQHRVAKGMSQCPAKPVEAVPERRCWVTSSSPMMKGVVQVAIWEWVSAWLMELTFFITLIHNGFFSGKEGRDSIPRLAVVVLYFLCFIIHFFYFWSLFLKFLTLVCAGAAWSLLNRALFAVVDRNFLFSHIIDNSEPLDFWEIEKSSSGTSFEARNYDAALSIHLQQPQQIPQSQTQKDNLAAAQKQVGNDQEKLRTDIYSAVDKTLDSVLINIVTMLGICIAQAFSTWTAQPLIDNSSTQIGSLALVASALTGIASMFRSVLHMGTATKAFNQLLSLKEIKINRQTIEYVERRPYRNEIVGFCNGYLQTRRITISDLFRIPSGTAMLLAVLFSPVFSLLPNESENSRRLSSFELCVQAMGQNVVFTTNRTNRHSVDTNTSQNTNSINVYCRFNTTRYNNSFSESIDLGPAANRLSSAWRNTEQASTARVIY
ncbi:hypothetical protein MANI_002389 [Metarhizium anisopliae]